MERLFDQLSADLESAITTFERKLNCGIVDAFFLIDALELALVAEMIVYEVES
jgi:hypothetical protein